MKPVLKPSGSCYTLFFFSSNPIIKLCPPLSSSFILLLSPSCCLDWPNGLLFRCDWVRILQVFLFLNHFLLLSFCETSQKQSKEEKKKKKVCGSKRSLRALEHLSCFGFKRELSHRLTPFRNARIANLAIYYWCLILMWLMWETMARCHSVGWWEYEWAKTKIQNNVKKNDIWKVRLRHKEYFLFPAVSFLLHSLLYTVCIILPAGVHHKKKKKELFGFADGTLIVLSASININMYLNVLFIQTETDSVRVVIYYCLHRCL